MNNQQFYNFSRIVYILCILRVKCIEAIVQVVCLKRLKISPFGSFELLLLLRVMGVSVPSLHIESTDSMIIMDKVEKSVISLHHINDLILYMK